MPKARTRHRNVAVLIALCTALLAPRGVASQNVEVDVRHIAAADSLFALGIERFDEGHLVEARALFEQIVDAYELNAATTAAALMLSKSDYRLGDYEAAFRELEDFVETYPSSGYVQDARHTLGLADDVLNRRPPDTVRVGIVLSLNGAEVTDSQSLFNGIRLAVEHYNLGGTTAPIKMVFRDSGTSPSGARHAVHQLADENVDFIVGTIYSEQAIAAAEAAEEERVVFVAPMATDERVSAEKRYAFQANPTIELRGRLMARFAVNGLRLRSLGVLTKHEPGGVSERLTDAFIQEASELGAEINLVHLLPDDNAWIRLSEDLRADTLRYVEALYVPITGEEPEIAIGGLLSSLDRMGANIRLLGNSAWHNLPMVTAASRYTATYSNDFFLNQSSPELTIFQARYGSLAGENPSRLAYAGYDVARFVLELALRDDEQPLYESIWFEPEYRGLASRIGFFGLNVNGAMFFHRYRDGELRLIR